MGNRRGLTNDIGSTGLNESWGQVQDDFLREWRGREKVRNIDEMLRNSPVVGALRLAIEMPVRDIDWHFVSDQGDEDPRVQLLNDAWENMTHSWPDHLVDALLMAFYGWSMFTITYERVNGRMLWRKFKMLGHDTVQRWLIADDGGLEGVQQWPHLWPAPIPIERMVVYRFRKTRNNPEGESILRPAWVPWYYLKNIQQVEAIGIERNLAGMPVIYPPMGADMSEGSTDKTLAERLVRNIRKDEQAGVVMPAPSGEGDHQRWRLELLSPASQGQVTDTDTVISRYEKRILMSSLAQFLMLGQDNVGSLATFTGANDFFTMAVNSIADNIADTFSKYAVTRLLELNGMDPDGIALVHSPAGNIGLDTVAQFLQSAGAFITWTADDEAWLRGIARLPEKDAGDLEVLREEEAQRQAERIQEIQEAMRQRAISTGADTNAAHFVADRHPQDDELRRLERKWTRTAAAFFQRQQQELLEDLDDA